MLLRLAGSRDARRPAGEGERRRRRGRVGRGGGPGGCALLYPPLLMTPGSFFLGVPDATCSGDSVGGWLGPHRAVRVSV